ncbi:hypothetical protein [Streptomyces sp. NPDC056160]|uniref:hypothetical protein n=1 Tax=Streptomyces sp. NPDC056160 TaxID=3345731 RepID=UPI0035DC5DCC
MRTPSIIRRLRARISDAQTNRLRIQLTTEKDRNRSLEQRVADLQVANEGAYHELSIARGVECLKSNCPRCKAVTNGGAA